MIIKSIYIGNSTEAFIEDNFEKNFNIIYSDDNNKGKTIVIQSIMYCLGNSPVFPASFPFRNYYHILTIESNGKEFGICRRKNSFIVKCESEIFIFDNISEFKRYWDKNITKLPVIIKDGRKKLTDLELLLQLFFVGQDKKMTHDIISNGWLKKADFYNMIYSMCGIENAFDNDDDMESLKARNNQLKEEKKSLLKKNKILKSNRAAVEILSSTNSRIVLEEKLKETEKIRDIISSLTSDRNNAIKRKTKNELVLKELRSLNRTMKTGKILCMNCGSTHISYESSDSEFNFDISTTDMRTNILKSIEEKIGIYDEEIERISEEIEHQQKKLNTLLETEDISIEELLLAKLDLDGTQDDDDKIEKISKEIYNLNNRIKQLEDQNRTISQESKENLENIVLEMNQFNKYIDPNISDIYEDIFTSKYKTHSGSEGTQFYLSKMYAFAKVLKHDYPIIVDSFRAEDLSTDREKRVISKFSELPNQLIFTTTLKEEEHLKYETLQNIHSIDYSGHKNYHILQKKYVDKFIEKLNSMMISLQGNEE